MPNWQSGRWFLQIAPPRGGEEKYVTSEFADVAQSPCGKPLRGHPLITILHPEYDHFYALNERLHTNMRYFLFFSTFLLSNWAAREPLLLCKCPFWTPWTGFIVWSSLSPGCNIPGCASDNWMDGSPITQDRAAGEQKQAATLIRGEVVGGGAVVLLILFIFCPEI